MLSRNFALVFCHFTHKLLVVIYKTEMCRLHEINFILEYFAF